MEAGKVSVGHCWWQMGDPTGWGPRTHGVLWTGGGKWLGPVTAKEVWSSCGWKYNSKSNALFLGGFSSADGLVKTGRKYRQKEIATLFESLLEPEVQSLGCTCVELTLGHLPQEAMGNTYLYLPLGKTYRSKKEPRAGNKRPDGFNNKGLI